MHSILLKLKTKKYLPYITVIFIVFFVFILTPHLGMAFGGDDIASFLVGMLSWLFVAFINVMGNLLLLLIDVLIKIAGYGDFMNAPIVEKGWVIIRDIGNIGIVFMLLAMAFSTLFKKGSYQYQSFLPKIVIAAILVNFSKFFTGLAISVSQVFMMEFVNAFKSAAAGNIVYGFGIQDLLAFRETASGGTSGTGAGIEVSDWSILGALVLGALMVGVAVIVVLSMVVMLLVRILLLWFLVMFSPVAFLGSVLPSQISKYASKWQEELVKWLIAGPMIAFMLWLALAVITEMTNEKKIINLSLQSAVSKGEADDWKAFANKVSGPQNMVDYLVTAGLFLGALFVAGQTGVAGAKFAGSAFGKIKGYGEKALSRGKKIVTSPLRGAKKMAGAGFRATQVPYLAQAWANRFKESKVGKFVGANKEHTKEVDEMRKARAMSWKYGGGDSSSWQAYQYRKELEDEKKLEESGVFRGGVDSIKDFYDKAIKEGNKGHARSALRRLSNAGKASTENIEDYKNMVDFNNLKGKERDNTMKFFDEMRERQSVKDRMADLTFGTAHVKDPASGEWKLEDLDNSRIITREQHTKDVASKFTANDFADKSIWKALEGIDIAGGKKQEMLHVVDKLATINNIKAITPEGRQKYIDILENIIPQAVATGKPDSQIQTYVDTLRNMHASDFDKGTGEATVINRITYDAPSGSSKERIINALNAMPGGPRTMPATINW
ncbi:MAG: hypothetical protein ABIF17_01680 [Patescibacteria group bacterium]